MFRKLLIANRGEVAARVARTARRMGIRVVAVASAADRDQAWLRTVDEVVTIGPGRAAQSYLDQAAILEAARRTGASAVHPGWGFLSENDVFATRCEAAGLTFVGPSPHHLRIMGDKAMARRTMTALGLPGIPGSPDAVADAAEAARVADEVGYPVLLKAVAGGGGRGMRAVEGPAEVAGAFAQASAEAAAAFGDGRMYVERRIRNGHHVEFQVIADRYGGVLVLGERECSLQRRHQKVLEEGPAPGLSEAERARILPLVADGVVYRVVRKLLILDGERLSFGERTALRRRAVGGRALDRSAAKMHGGARSSRDAVRSTHRDALVARRSVRARCFAVSPSASTRASGSR
jgi:acetyl-CoA carboxylase biotin carboxylase subunit